MMYLMEGKKLLDVNVLDRRKLLNLSLPTLVLRGFLRFVFLFTLLYITGVGKHRLFNSFVSQKRQPI